MRLENESFTIFEVAYTKLSLKRRISLSLLKILFQSYDVINWLICFARMSLYKGQLSRKCSSVSTTGCGQTGHRRSSIGFPRQQACLDGQREHTGA